MANQFTASITSLNLSASEISGMTGWPKMMTNDYLTNFANFTEIAMKSDELVELVETNEANILINTGNITINTQNINLNRIDIDLNRTDINTNTTNIGINATNIGINATNLTNHETLNSAHGVTGFNVGTEDFAQPAIGGVVFLAALIADLTQIVTADLLAAPVAYNQAYTQLASNLTNQNKAKINEIVVKINSIIAGQISANQMAVI